MHISYKPLWHTLVECNMRKEDLRLAAGLTTNMIANMGKGKNLSLIHILLPMTDTTAEPEDYTGEDGLLY